MLALVAPRQLQVLLWRLLRFLDETVEQDHSALFVDVEEHPCNSVLRQARSHFIHAIAQWLANGHADGPAELYGFDILPNSFPILA